jgi:hypothetical protein
MSQSGDPGPLSRRHFLYAVGGTAAAALGGWVLHRNLAPPLLAPESAAPRLRSGIAIAPSEFGAELFDAAGGAPLCGVNQLGSFVLAQMDGRSSVAEIARRVAARTPGAANRDAVEASTAMFLAELGSAGVLAAPFHVNIHSCEISA